MNSARFDYEGAHFEIVKDYLDLEEESIQNHK